MQGQVGTRPSREGNEAIPVQVVGELSLNPLGVGTVGVCIIIKKTTRGVEILKIGVMEAGVGREKCR